MDSSSPARISRRKQSNVAKSTLKKNIKKINKNKKKNGETFKGELDTTGANSTPLGSIKRRGLQPQWQNPTSAIPSPPKPNTLYPPPRPTIKSSFLPFDPREPFKYSSNFIPPPYGGHRTFKPTSFSSTLDPFYFKPISASSNDAPSRSVSVKDSASHKPDRKPGKLKKGAAMDPFEVRIKFTQYLQHLNASVTSANKTALYALKYRDMDEDLHSCILEQLERNSMNNRANIMYFIEHLCDLASRENHHDYVRMMQRDILRIVDAVAPEDGSGAANVKVVRKVLNALQTKSYLLKQTVVEIEELLIERDVGHEDDESEANEIGDVERSGMNEDYNRGLGGIGAGGKGFSGVRTFDRKQIEQRIEEDRERHKRLRETIWAIPTANTAAGTDSAPTSAIELTHTPDPKSFGIPGGTVGPPIPNVIIGPGYTSEEMLFHEREFNKLWEETSDVGSDDFDLYAEEAEERKMAARDWGIQHSGKATTSD